MPKETPLVFHRVSNYDYHFIIKKIINEFEWQFECIGENKEKYKKFSVLTKKEIIKNDTASNETVETISYKKKIY